MAENGLRKWVKENWVDIANKKPWDGSARNAEEKVEKKENIQNACPLQKQER